VTGEEWDYSIAAPAFESDTPRCAPQGGCAMCWSTHAALRSRPAANAIPRRRVFDDRLDGPHHLSILGAKSELSSGSMTGSQSFATRRGVQGRSQLIRSAIDR